jgi:hypothetical protein
MQLNMLYLSHTDVSLAQYKFTIREEEQWSFLAEQQAIFGKDVPINDSDVRLMMKQRWSPTPPYCGRMNAIKHVIPGVAKMLSMGALPLR